MYSPQAAPSAIAHRGLRHGAPENSIPAFRAALDAGADGIELDVHITIDGGVFVHHDPIPRALDGSGTLVVRTFATADSEYIRGLELASGIGIPTLDEAIEEIAQRADVYIEIKAQGAEEAVAHCLRRHEALLSRCAVHAFDHRVVRKLAGLLPSVRTGVLQASYPIDSRAVMRAAGATDLWQHVEFIDASLVADVASSGGRVIAWTSNDSAQWERLAESGVAAICTDRVDEYVRSVKKKGANPVQKG